jgi:dTDP-4-dehydrorhamnose reductase
MRRIVVTGAGGQLGRELLRSAWPDDVQVTGLGRSDLDLSEVAEIAPTLEALEPDVVINAAAYTAVDRAESEPELAELVNATAVGAIATTCERNDARLIHFSTDYVFDGTKDGWYVEDDPIAPLGVYGRTKAQGEDRARAAPRHLILRTSWVYGALGANFVATMRRLGATRADLGVVADQVGCPTATTDISTAVVALSAEPHGEELCGTYHLAGPTATSWYEFARAILADRLADGLEIRPLTTAEYPTDAARPANSRLDSSRIEQLRGIRLSSWQDAMPRVVAELEDPTSGG